ncbi:hypothetical protein PR202_ga27470 [Eleusine coracana subsp. coracana]|uniref:KIB1-4 beta-propeller domain-containing protein n=1 Tax=Eleusine coracana subsp. coracana TaxID=191504 RepID=A0AAV5DH89_ELECO|nr:hypothetical protein QOZ80_8AG0620220 [Eleusine coracana subsp. coracana]GJN09462.1 hypothetical protein PR202_ga27470 [Eleusine coracana subsp. coracana]
MSCWAATFSNTMAAASIVSKLTDKIADRLASLVCGFSSLPTTYDAGGYFMLPSPSPDRHPHPYRPPYGRTSWASPPSSSSSSLRQRVASSTTADPADNDNDEEEEEEEEEGSVRATSSSPHDDDDDDAAALPCLAFQSQHGYTLLSLDGGDDGGEVVMRPVLGRRLVPSPYGGLVLAADVCYNHPCRLIDPFTGAVTTLLPDLPLPRSETEPISCAADEPPRTSSRHPRATDDGIAWDWSPHGVLLARGDTAFFYSFQQPADGWVPVHQSWRGSHMSVNHRGGRFFLFEHRSLRTTVVDAATLRVAGVIPPPQQQQLDAEDVDGAYLAPCAGGDEALLLVHRAGDRRGGRAVVSEAYRARLRGGRRGGGPRWRRVGDVGDRAVFVDGAHAFTVRAGPKVRRNHVYVTMSCQAAAGGGAEYGVAVVDLRRPEWQGRVKVRSGEVDRAWGCQPYWIVPKDHLARKKMVINERGF